MADNSYKVTAEISTSQSVTNLRALNTAIDQTTTALKALNTVTKEGEANLKSMVSSITGMLSAYRQAAAAEKDLAQAKIATAKADATAQANADKSSATQALAAQRNAAAAKQTVSAQREAANIDNDRARLQNTLANGESQRAVATERLTLAQQQYNDRQSKAKQSELELQDNLSNTRYLLYDVGATYRTMSIGLEALPVATAAVAASYQRDFANVIRVTESSAEQNAALKDSLKGIAEEIPQSFGNLTQIAQLGSQMGIPVDELSKFTEVTAKFVAVTGVAADTASSLFGRLDTAFNANNQIPDFFNKVGASIADVGAKTVATDPEIAAMLNQIGSLGASAGFSAPQIIGLSAALASVRVQPELARGSLTRIFQELDRATTDGGKGLDAYAKLLGVTQQQAASLWKTDPSQFFQRMIQGLNGIYTAGGNLTTTFDALGIKQVRDVSALTKLAVGYDTLTTSMTAANDAYNSGTALDKQAEPIFNTISAKVQLLANAFKNLADTLGAGGLGPLGVVLETITNLVKGLDDLAKTNPAILTVINTLLGLSAVAGVLMGMKAAQTFVLAGIVSFQQMLGSTASRAVSFTGIIKQLAVAQLIAKGATEAQANALLKESTALGAVMTAGKLTTANLQTGATSMAAMGTASAEAGVKMGGTASALRSIGSSALGLVGGLPGLISLIGIGLVSAMVSAQQQGDQLAKTLGESLNDATQNAAKNAADFLKNFKVSNNPTGGIGFSFGDYDKSIGEIATRAGVDMTKLGDALTKGKQGLEDFKRYMDSYAKSQGFAGGMGDFQIASGGLPGTKAADLYFIEQSIEREAQKSQEAADAAKNVDGAMGKSATSAQAAADAANNLDDGLSGSTTAADALDKALKAISDTVFGIVDAQGALGDSLNKLGAGLQKSGSFNNSEAGRENLKNMEDALQKARDFYALQLQSGQLSKDQATAGYGDFVNQLIAKVKAQGGNLGPIEDLAHQTVTAFKNVIGTDATGANAPTIQVQTRVDAVQPVQQAKSVGQQVSAVIAAEAPTLNITANADQASQEVYTLALSIAKLTGMPLDIVIDALTNPASEKATAVQDFINQVVKDPKKFSINADTTAAVQNVQNFAAYAAKQLTAVQSYVNSVAATAPTLAQYIVPGVKPNLSGTPYKPGLGGGTVSSMQTVAAPAQVQATAQANAAQASLGDTINNNVNAGYQKQALAADKAGQKGKKAGQAAADGWKDAGNAIDEATANADDYASRLKQGLDRAFERQYGMQSATDAYYQKLNDIKKTRDDEIKQVEDLRDKIKQANDEMNKDLIDANKAKIEQSISIKYGESARAADYGNQAQTALDNAAAKKKEIDADQQQADSIQAGIGQLTGYSDAAIKNRAALRDLEQAHNDMIVAYAKTGASIDQVRAYAANLNGQFQRDVGQIGFNQQAVQNLTGDLGRYIDVINRVPYLKPTTVTADTTQAEDALNNLGNDYTGLGNDLANNPLDVTLRANWDWDVKQISSTMWSAISDQMGVDKAAGYVKANYDGGQILGFASGGMVPGTPPANPKQDNMLASVDGRGMVSIRSREWIMPEPAVDYYGAAFMENIQKMRLPRYAMGGSVGGSRSSGAAGGPTLVELTAEQLAFLAETMGRDVKLYADNRLIAESANRGNREIASEGGRR